MTHPSRTRWRSGGPLRWGAALLLTVLAGSVGGQDSPPPAAPQGPPVFGEAMDVTVVNVDVYVTDKDGKRVTGLTRDDFEILEDGLPMRVTNFVSVEGGVEQRAPSAAPTPVPPPDSEPSLRIEPAREAVASDERLHLIVYFDNLYLKPFNRNKVTREVRRFLDDTLGLDDRVMLVTHERSLHVRQGFTTNLSAIKDQLYEIEDHSGFGIQGASRRREVIRRIERSQSFAEAESHVDFYAKEVAHDLEVSLDNLRELVGSLAGLPGRKALLYVSDGIPLSPAEDLFYMIDLKFSTEGVSAQLRAARYRSLRRFRELTAQANANRVTLYTLEAAGLRSHGSLSAEYGGTDQSYIEVDFARMSNEQAPLQIFAEDTGGLAAFNTNDIDGALARVGEDFGWYYSLGYMPPHAADGRYYEIEVRTKRKDLKVRHRTGYRARTPDTRIRDGTLAALLYGQEANPLEIALALEPGRRQSGGHYLLPLLVRIPIANVTLVPAAEIHRGRLSVSVAAIDEAGAVSPVEVTPVPIEIPPEDLELARQKLYTYAVEVMMKPGEQTVAVGVYDEIGRVTSFVRRPVRVGG